MDTRNKQSLSSEDIAFIQSSYRDAKRKPSQREKLKDLYPDVTPAEFADLTSTPVTDWETSTKPTRAKKTGCGRQVCARSSAGSSDLPFVRLAGRIGAG